MPNKTRKGRVTAGAEGPTVGITIRPSIVLLSYYEEVAERANRMLRSKGERGRVSVQQVMLQRLRSLPAFQAHVAKDKESGST